MSSKRIKEIVKNAEPAKGTNADPGQLGQYSVTNQVNEGDLNQYLSSRGINPKFVSRETKISHAKSATFQKWKANHKNEEVENEDPLIEDAILDKFLSSRGINPKYATRNMKVSHSKSGEFLKWKKDHMFEEIVTEETDEKDMVCFDIPLLIRVLEYTREDMKTDIELHNMVERLINMRDNVPLDMTHYDDITSKLVKENHIAIAMGKMLDDESGMILTQIEELERACAMIRSYIGKDYEKQLPAWVQAKVTLATDYMSTVGNYLVSKNEKVNEDYAQGVQGHLSQGTLDSIKNKRNVKINLGKPTYNPKPKTLVKKPAKKVSFLSKLLSKEELELEEAKTTQGTALDKFRQASAERAKKHDEIQKNQSKEGSGMISAIDRLQKHMNKEEVEKDDKVKQYRPGHPMYKSDVSLYRKTPKSISKSLATHGARYFSNTDDANYKTTDKEAPRYRNEEVEQIDETPGAQAMKASGVKQSPDKLLARTGMNMAHKFPRKGQTNLGNIPGMNTPGVSKDTADYAERRRGDRAKELKPAIKASLGTHGPKGKLPEEVEQIDELKKSTVFSWLKKQPVVPEKKPGMSRKDHNQRIKIHNKNWNSALDRLSGYKPTSEDVFQDPQAATQTSFDNGTSTNDKQEGMSKSARMIKALYKKHNMKEDTYDWEKDDKNQTSPGKGTKEVKEKPDARAILTGGKTLTGEKRDTLEIDPMMKNRPDLNGTVKDDDKSKKNNKINN